LGSEENNVELFFCQDKKFDETINILLSRFIEALFEFYFNKHFDNQTWMSIVTLCKEKKIF
jgi:hypothetical protein